MIEAAPFPSDRIGRVITVHIEAVHIEPVRLGTWPTPLEPCGWPSAWDGDA